MHFLQFAAGVLVENGGGGRGAQLLHQFLVGVELYTDFFGDLAERFGAALGMLLFVLRQGGLRILGREDGGCFAGAGGPEDGDHDVTQLHFAGRDPGPGVVPELVAVRAVGVGEGVDDSRRGSFAIAYPGAFLKLLPDAVGHRFADQLLKGFLAEVVAFAVDHGTDNRLFAVGGQVDGQRLLLDHAGIAGQPAGCLERADHFDTLSFEQRQKLARSLVEEVVLDDSDAHIYFKIPLPKPPFHPSGKGPASRVSRGLGLRSAPAQDVKVGMPLEKISGGGDCDHDAGADILTQAYSGRLGHGLGSRLG